MKYTVEIHDNFDRFLISQGFKNSKSDRDVNKLKEILLNHGEMFPMTTFGGIEYTCIVPESMGEVFTEEDKGSIKKEECEEDEKIQEENVDQEISRVSLLKNSIRSMEKAPCFAKSLGYWTYEVCPFRNVRQYHREGKEKLTTFSLGLYVANSEEEVVEDEMMDNQDDKGRSASLIPVMSQSYSGGHANRRSIVRYACDRTMKGGAKIVNVKENPTHVYTIVVATDKICDTNDDLVYSLLAPLQKQCLRKIGSWWTYEVCSGKRVRQYHREKDGTQTQHILGNYDKLANTRHQRSQSSISASSSSSSSSSSNGTETSETAGVLTEFYTSGSVCDITQQPRKATVTYRCSEMEKFSVIESVVESAPCTYAINILTPLLCSHPDFRDSHSSSNLAKLHCLPTNEFQ